MVQEFSEQQEDYSFSVPHQLRVPGAHLRHVMSQSQSAIALGPVALLRFAVCRCGLRRSAPRRKGLRLRLRCALAACGPLAPGKACPPRRALAAARCGCALRRLGPWRGRGGGEVEMRLRRATAACEGWPPMEGGAHGAGPVLLRPRTKKALSGSVMGNYGRRGGVNKGLECVIAFAIVLVQSPSLGFHAPRCPPPSPRPDSRGQARLNNT